MEIETEEPSNPFVQVFTPQGMEEMGLDLATGLDLEQRYIALHKAGKDLEELRRKGKLEDELRAVSAAVSPGPSRSSSGPRTIGSMPSRCAVR